MEEIFDLMILGAGAAGLTAGIYSSRARLSTLILNEGVIGGQMVLTNEIANYPGVATTKGYTLAGIMKKQAKDFGCRIISNIKIKEYRLNDTLKTIVLEDGLKFRARAVILAPGGKPRSLNIPGENLSTRNLTEMKIGGVFIFIGYLPNTDSIRNVVNLNELNEIMVDPDMKTYIPGVFAAGDCIAKKYRQINTAVAEGTIAALSASEYVRNSKQ